jgi:hypothetical protein
MNSNFHKSQDTFIITDDKERIVQLSKEQAKELYQWLRTNLDQAPVREGDYVVVVQEHGTTVGRFLGWENEGYNIHHHEAGKMWFNTQLYPFEILIRGAELK